MNKLNIILVFIYSHAVFGLSEEITTAEPMPKLFEPLPVKGELGEFFEGDILLTDRQKSALISKDNRNGLIDISKRWPYNTLVYYFADNEFTATAILYIRAALWDIENSSCVRFRERQYTNEYAVRITNAGGNVCNSYVGYVYEEQGSNGYQPLNLGPGCFDHGTIIHEFLHALGFFHMQSTYNRDDYVCIVWRNIEEGMEHNFEKMDNMTVTNFGLEYDYNSVMHYSSTAFSKNGLRTIIPVERGAMIGQRVGLSRGDIFKLNRMYNCYTNKLMD